MPPTRCRGRWRCHGWVLAHRARACQSPRRALAIRATPFRSSCPALSRASTSCFRLTASKTWMPGTSPAMTNQLVHSTRHYSMATHKLLLLPGDGIGPEVMAEVKKLIAWMNAHGMGTFETEEGLVGGSCYDAHKVSITDETMAKAHAADAVLVRRGRRAEVGQGALRRAAGGGPAAAAQGPRALRQPPPGGDLSGAGRRLGAQARAGRRPRHHHPPRAHRRRLFRRAEDHHRSRQRPEARHRHPGLRHLRDRADRPRRLRAGAEAQATRSPRWRSATS